jgi:hypothetical protein
MLLRNLDLTLGAANGAIGVVKAMTANANGNITAITVHLRDTQKDIVVRRVESKVIHFNGARYCKTTFPSAPGLCGHGPQVSRCVVHLPVLLPIS